MKDNRGEAGQTSRGEISSFIKFKIPSEVPRTRLGYQAARKAPLATVGKISPGTGEDSFPLPVHRG